MIVFRATIQNTADGRWEWFAWLDNKMKGPKRWTSRGVGRLESDRKYVNFRDAKAALLRAVNAMEGDVYDLHKSVWLYEDGRRRKNVEFERLEIAAD